MVSERADCQCVLNINFCSTPGVEQDDSPSQQDDVSYMESLDLGENN